MHAFIILHADCMSFARLLNGSIPTMLEKSEVLGSIYTKKMIHYFCCLFISSRRALALIKLASFLSQSPHENLRGSGSILSHGHSELFNIAFGIANLPGRDGWIAICRGIETRFEELIGRE